MLKLKQVFCSTDLENASWIYLSQYEKCSLWDCSWAIYKWESSGPSTVCLLCLKVDLILAILYSHVISYQISSCQLAKIGFQDVAHPVPKVTNVRFR